MSYRIRLGISKKGHMNLNHRKNGIFEGSRKTRIIFNVLMMSSILLEKFQANMKDVKKNYRLNS